MIERIITVGGFTLLSRITGFIRDIILAAVLGAGPVADAFFVAFRLPNHFRAIFAEGAFNAAFVPAYARIREQGGAQRAGLFADRIFTLLLGSQVVLLAAALLFTPAVIDVLAPGFARDPGRFALATDLTRITFPYLLLITLVTLYGGILNALQRFAAAAAASTLLNLSMMVTLALVVFFPTAGHAAAWGVLISGILQALLVGGDTWRAGAMTVLRWPELDADVRQFFRALGPATVGSMGVQLALFADTIIASFLPAGALSALYYADRLNQLPIGVIGIAAGTVILPEMSRRIAGGDHHGAAHAQNRAIEFTLLLSIPCVVAFLVIPDLIMRALFMRGAFTAADADAAGRTLMAYAFGLLPFVLIRSTVATFFARGDTATPVKAALIAAAVNIGFKVLLMGPLAQVGLALATSIGAWINLGLVIWFAKRAGHVSHDGRLRQSMLRLAIAGVVLAAVLWLCREPMIRWLADWQGPRDLAALAIIGAIGAAVYGGTVLVMFGRDWVATFRAKTRARSTVRSLNQRSSRYCRMAEVDITPSQRYGDRPRLLLYPLQEFMTSTRLVSSFSLMYGARKLAVPFVLATLVASCGERQPQGGPPPPAVTVAKPIKRTVFDYDEYVGRFTAINSVEVRARVSGYLDGLHFKDGQLVKQGDLLFTIDKRPFQNTLDQARANLVQAQSNLAYTESDYTRGQQLVRDKTITDQTFEQRAQAFRNAKASVSNNEAAVRQAELDMEFTELRAPVNGRIGDRRVSPGNLVTGGTAGNTTLLATIVSTDPIYFEFTFDEASYLRYERVANSGGQDVASRNAGVPIALKLIDENDFDHKGRMDFVDNVIDRSTGTIRGRAVFENPNGVFTPGMFARVRVPGSSPYEGLLVPDAAIGTEQARRFVVVIDEQDTARQKYVTLGQLTADNLRVIKDGIAPDDRIVVSGLMQARPGQKVRPEEQGAKPATPGGPAGAPQQPK